MSEEDEPIEDLKALAHSARYRILAVLTDGERNVGEIEEASGIGQPALSQQLAILRKAGLVSSRREAKQVFYAIEREAVARLADAVAALLPGEPDQASPPRRPRSTGAAVFARLGS